MTDRVVRPTLPVKAPVQLRVGRLAVLALILIAAALYVPPLRDFFAQQDRYHHEAVVLAQKQAENQVLRQQLEQMRDKDYITRRARDEFQLIPRGMQAFVVTGLPETGSVQRSRPAAEPASPSLADRLVDLWQTLLR